MKPLLIGEQNPYQSDPRLAQRFALYPEPPNCAGWNLCCRIMQLKKAEYLERFDRVNLCAGKWSMREARAKADLLRNNPGQTLVLCGAKVAAAFGRKFVPFTHDETPDYYRPKSDPSFIAIRRRIVILPHPSGLSRAWNEPGAFERARSVLREAGVL